MATFAAVSTASDNAPVARVPTPTTPRQSTNTPERSQPDTDDHAPSPSTPTRHSFGGLLGQRPLPDEFPTPPTQRQVQDAAKRSVSHRKTKSLGTGQDVEMAEADDDDENIAEDDGESDNESVTSQSPKSSKKKKGQRFFCTDFPPCQLSFTRSEHLARHIRKHTGERPFQCHCSRRFSRLDNLRQHAQTVHVNEEIPAESLAATSTRFQRQIRTDRIRPPTNRSRASTLSSTGVPPPRGHGRNLSTSSIGSTSSNFSTSEDARRRPQPLAMANDGGARARLSLETYGGGVSVSPQQHYIYYNQSPTGYSTPTSTAYSTGGQSPRFQSGMASPNPTISRSSFYNGSRRRLSVPGVQNPYHNPTYPGPYFSPIPSGQSATFSQNGSVLASPTTSIFSHGRRDSETEMEYRRRTWHPSTSSQYAQRPATSGLAYHQTADEPRPAFTQQQAASQMTRLPGIESFDHAPPPSGRQPDAMEVDTSPRPMSSSRELQQGLTRLDITAANAPVEGQWQAQQGAPPPHQQQPLYYPQQGPTQQYVQPKHVSMPEGPVTPRRNKRQGWYGGPVTPQQSQSGAQGGPYMIHRPSPEDSGSSDGVPTPSASQGNEYNPVIINPSGMASDHAYPPGTAVTVDEHKVYHSPALHHSSHMQHKEDRIRTDSGFQTYAGRLQQQRASPSHIYPLQSGHDPRFAQASYGQQPNNDMAKLEALVAVATSEGSRAERRS